MSFFSTKDAYFTLSSSETFMKFRMTYICASHSSATKESGDLLKSGAFIRLNLSYKSGLAGIGDA